MDGRGKTKVSRKRQLILDVGDDFRHRINSHVIIGNKNRFNLIYYEKNRSTYSRSIRMMRLLYFRRDRGDYKMIGRNVSDNFLS
jgi:hypothetical protein